MSQTQYVKRSDTQIDAYHPHSSGLSMNGFITVSEQRACKWVLWGVTGLQPPQSPQGVKGEIFCASDDLLPEVIESAKRHLNEAFTHVNGMSAVEAV